MKYEIKLPKQKATKELLLEELKNIAIALNKNELSYDEIQDNSNYSVSTYRNYFGSVRKALEQANLQSSRNWKTSEIEYLDNIISIWAYLGRQPKMAEMNMPISKHSSSSYTHFFGSWTNVLIRLNEYINEENKNIVDNKTQQIDVSSHKTSRNINLRLRFLVMKRDNFKCCCCGRSPATNPGLELHIDHIIPWSKGGETTIDNLQTLCRDCNLGKSNL